MEQLRKTFAVHSYDVDAFREVAVPALTGFLIEAAGRHAAGLGVGLDTLMARGLTWVLARQRIEVAAPIRLDDLLEVTTWPAGIDRLAALRDFVVRRVGTDGAAPAAGGGAAAAVEPAPLEVARGTTEWFVLDLETRRPVRPGAVLDPRFPRPTTPPVLPPGPHRLPELATWELEKRFHIRYADIDVNDHVNNGSYVAWALEAIPRDVWHGRRLAALDVAYLAECRYGSAVLSRQARAADDTFHHAIVREEDGKELARLVTRWVGRAP